MQRFLAILLALTLSGCMTYDGYGYRDDGYYDDRYAEQGYDRYGYSRYDRYGYDYGRAYYPDYVYWSDYYSVLWPVYRGYYDPFYTPGFYYGVTWYPRTYFGLNHYWNSWPYYQAYAPYRYSYWDGYYDNWDRRRGQLSDRVANGYNVGGNNSYLYGSARNEAEQLSRRTGAAYQHNGAQPGLQYDPFAAQRTSPLTRERSWGRDAPTLRGEYPGRGQPASGALGNADGGGLRSRDELRRMEPAYRSRDSINSGGYPSGQSEPSRARTYDRGAPARDQAGRQSGWVSETPEDQQPASERYERARPAPYYREVGGAQVPMTRRQSLDAPMERRTPRQQEISEYRNSAPVESGGTRFRERAEPYSGRQSAPDYQPMQRSEAPRYQRSEQADLMPRQEAPQREVFQQRSAPRYEAPAQPRYEAPAPRYEAPSRSMDSERSRPERSAPSAGGSARDEARHSQDEN